MCCRMDLGLLSNGVFSSLPSRTRFSSICEVQKNIYRRGGGEADRKRHHGRQVQVYSAQQGHLLDCAKAREGTVWTGV